jgi:hypothetical protein
LSQAVVLKCKVAQLAITQAERPTSLEVSLQVGSLSRGPTELQIDASQLAKDFGIPAGRLGSKELLKPGDRIPILFESLNDLFKQG